MQTQGRFWPSVWETLKDLFRACVEDLRTGGLHARVLRAPSEVALDPAAEVDSCVITATSEAPKRVVVQVVTTTGHVVELSMLPIVAHDASDNLLRAAAHAKMPHPKVAS